ncbi:MAG TPA: TerC family protein [Steroidobacteraceae bacterium]|jgi:predicted tellurium resistance membrane protein TerC|nr:TerC family protein [Steroidobacteraceae bacterium]
MTLFASPQDWIALAVLTLLETVLGIDNVIFLTILVSRLPLAQQPRARTVGLSLAMLTRLALLFCVVWLARLTAPLFAVYGQQFSGRDLIVGAGGLFLLAKSVLEIHKTVAEAEAPRAAHVLGTFVGVVTQIALLDIVFSLDSVFTAVGLAKPEQAPIMAIAIVLSIVVMMWLSGPIAAFVARYPSMKILALAFLVLIGVALLAEAFDFEVPKGYLYFAMAFAFVVELVNIRIRR